MPDFEDKIPISEFSYTNTLHNTDQAPIIQQDGADWDNFRTSMADIGLHINKDMEYVTDLHTTSKKIIGAINELADGGGGSVDITTEIDTPAPIQTFSDGGDNIPMKSCEVAIVSQQESGTPSPSNPLPITGVSSVNATVAQVNFWDGYWEEGGIDTTTGEDVSSTGYDRSRLISCTPNMSFYGKSYGTQQLVFYFYDDKKHYLSFTVGTNTTVTTPNNCYYFRLRIANSSQSIPLSNLIVSINYPSTETTQKPVATTTSVSLGQTIYGGTADVVGGNGIKTWIMLNFSDLDFGASAAENHIFRGEYNGDFYSNIKFPPDSSTATTAFTEHYSAMAHGPISASDNGKFSLKDTGTHARFVFIDNNYSTVSGFIAARNSDKIVIPVISAIPFTFTGANIPTLSGENNVYADSGDVNELEYFNDKADDIASMVRLMTRT